VDGGSRFQAGRPLKTSAKRPHRERVGAILRRRWTGPDAALIRMSTAPRTGSDRGWNALASVKAEGDMRKPKGELSSKNGLSVSMLLGAAGRTWLGRAESQGVGLGALAKMAGCGNGCPASEGRGGPFLEKKQILSRFEQNGG
jgi:hypothetical protein